MLSPERKRKLFFAGVFAVPIVLVKAVRVAAGRRWTGEGARRHAPARRASAGAGHTD